ncbi:DUF1275 family protein, partial [Streptomyces beihaiensis]
VLGGHPGGAWRTTELAAAAAAMGGQSAAMLAAGTSAAPTTYFTGTLTALVSDTVTGAGRRADRFLVAARLCAVAAGACCAVAVHVAAPPWGFALPAVLTAAAVVCQKPAQRLRIAVTSVHGNPMHGPDNSGH